MKKKRVLLVLIAILGIIAIITGVTYAFFSFTKHGSTENVIRTGLLKTVHTVYADSRMR